MVGAVLESIGDRPDLVVVTVTRPHAGALEDVTATIGAVLHPLATLGAAAESVVGSGTEVEEMPAISLWAGRVGPLLPVELSATRLADDTWQFDGWPEQVDFTPSALLAVADPFTFPMSEFLLWLEERQPGLPVVGGNASGARGPGGSRLVLGSRVLGSGAAAVLLGSGIEVEAVVSQGSRPYGRLLTVTRSDRNIVYEVAGKPAMECLVDQITDALRPADVAGIEGNGLFIGRLVDEHVTHPGPGDFLVRNVVGVDRSTGAVAVEDRVPLGSTIQFHLRDAGTAGEELDDLLAHRTADGRAALPVQRPRDPSVRRGRPRCGSRRARRSGRCPSEGSSPPASSVRSAASISSIPSPSPWLCSATGDATAQRTPDRRHRRAARPVGFAEMSHPPPARLLPPPDEALEQRGVNVIRGLAMDAPRAANSGHPGTAMALAPLAHVLFTRVLHHDPSDPRWPDRDRFVLSNGHASILLYSMLHLTGYGLTLDDLRAFRQLGQPHPRPPRDQPRPRDRADHRTPRSGRGQRRRSWASPSGGSAPTSRPSSATTTPMWWPVTAASRKASPTRPPRSPATSASVGWSTCTTTTTSPSTARPSSPTTTTWPSRFAAYGWSVEDVGEVANDLDALEAALLQARAHEDRPSLIILRSHIGYPSPHLTDTAKAHGDPFGEEEIRLTKELLGLPVDQTFWVPDEVLDLYRSCIPRGRAEREARAARITASDGEAARWTAAQEGHGLPGWDEALPSFTPDDGPMATRKAIKACLDATAASIPGLIPGSADLTGNTGMALAGARAQSSEEPGGSLVHYGIREHGMGAVMTGMAVHGGILPIGGTFFVFSDYMRGAVRVAALSGAHVVYSWTHDSIGLGQDGPTHQPVEQLAAVRAMPGLRVIRPADANETVEAWRLAVAGDQPTALVLSRQELPILAETGSLARRGVACGAYVLRDPGGGSDRPRADRDRQRGPALRRGG